MTDQAGTGLSGRKAYGKEQPSPPVLLNVLPLVLPQTITPTGTVATPSMPKQPPEFDPLPPPEQLPFAPVS